MSNLNQSTRDLVDKTVNFANELSGINRLPSPSREHRRRFGKEHEWMRLENAEALGLITHQEGTRMVALRALFLRQLVSMIAKNRAQSV